MIVITKDFSTPSPQPPRRGRPDICGSSRAEEGGGGASVVINENNDDDNDKDDGPERAFSMEMHLPRPAFGSRLRLGRLRIRIGPRMST